MHKVCLVSPNSKGLFYCVSLIICLTYLKIWPPLISSISRRAVMLLFKFFRLFLIEFRFKHRCRSTIVRLLIFLFFPPSLGSWFKWRPRKGSPSRHCHWWHSYSWKRSRLFGRMGCYISGKGLNLLLSFCNFPTLLFCWRKLVNPNPVSLYLFFWSSFGRTCRSSNTSSFSVICAS